MVSHGGVKGLLCHSPFTAATRMVPHRAFQAAREGDLAALRDLASSSSLPSDISDAQGAGPVHYAARCGQLDCLQLLVRDLGLSAESRALNGASPVHDAAASGNNRELKWLVDQGGCNIKARFPEAL